MAEALFAEIEKARLERGAAKEQADKWLRQVELLDVRIEALEHAARLRPLRPDTPRVRTESGGGGKGRQPGAISRTWRHVLATVAVSHPGGADEAEIAEIGRMAGLPNIRPKDVRDRMMNYEQHGYVEPALSGWRVTPHAINRFGSDNTENGADQSDEELHDANS